MAANPVIKAASVQAAVDVPVGDVAAAADELHPEMVQHLKVQLAGMEPLFHETFLSILKIYLPGMVSPPQFGTWCSSRAGKFCEVGVLQ